jgi:2-amino-4-hydroxy-6-hydroxymethyldihydropteridine diphosphokinase
MGAERRAHVQRVANVVAGWGDAMRIAAGERDRWLRAVWLHDALRDAPEAELARLAPDATGPVELLHGPAGAARAWEEGERDAGVLDAVRYHSIGSASWDMVGRVLYCADYLEPGRPFQPEARAALARRFPEAPDEVLRTVAGERMRWLIRSGWSIPEATWRFWNGLVEDR